MDHERDIARIELQERALRPARFDASSAWELGTRIRSIALGRSAALSIEIRIAANTVFFCAMPGTTPSNADWARRKRNAVELLQKSSYRLGLELDRDGTSLERKMGLPLRDYATHGGGFPIVVGEAFVGCVTVSGVPQREDHGIVVEALAGLCAIPIAQVALD